MSNKVTSSIINEVVVKHWTHSVNGFETVNTVDDMPFSSFINYVDNLSTIVDVSWSVDFLNPKFTRATVYVEF